MRANNQTDRRPASRARRIYEERDSEPLEIFTK